MANPNGNPNALALYRLNSKTKGLKIKEMQKSANGHARRSAALSQALDLQALLLCDARDPKTKASVRASIARSWAILQETIRVMRGIPSPGQLRPDLDPVQLARANKRHKLRNSLNVQSVVQKAVFIEDESEEAKPGPSVKSQPATTTPHNKFKESTSELGTVPAPPTGEGTK